VTRVTDAVRSVKPEAEMSKVSEECVKLLVKRLEQVVDGSSVFWWDRNMAASWRAHAQAALNRYKRETAPKPKPEPKPGEWWFVRDSGAGNSTNIAILLREPKKWAAGPLLGSYFLTDWIPIARVENLPEGWGE